MAIEDFSATSASALHLNYPPTAGSVSLVGGGSSAALSGAASGGSAFNSRSLTSVSVHPAALLTILDHYLRRDDPEPAPAKSADASGAAAARASTAADDQDPTDSTSAQTGATRVIGTLLGVRTDSDIEIRTAFAVPHKETSEQVQVDIEYHVKMLELHTKVNPEEVIVGWYATVGGAGSHAAAVEAAASAAEAANDAGLNTYSALIQDFYSKETAPHQAVHLTVDTDVTKGDLGVRAFIGSPIGLTPKAENAAFVPLPVTLLSSPAERPTLSLLSSLSAASTASLAADATAAPGKAGATASPAGAAKPAVPNTILSDLGALALALRQIHAQLERVLGYVRDVVEGRRAGDATVGRFIIDAVSRIPVSAASASANESAAQQAAAAAANKASTATQQQGQVGAGGAAGAGSTEETQLETLFNAHLQDVLMISYLANVVRAQAEVSSRLTLLT